MMNVAMELKVAIETWAEGLRRTSGLANVTRQGKLPPRAFGLYLESLRYLFAKSQESLALAAIEASRRGLAELSTYLDQKAREERGHDAWASDDLGRLPRDVMHDLKPARAIVELVDLQRALIAEHPVCMAVYALWAEYFTVLLADEWLEALGVCGYDRGQVSAIAKHLDADRDHAARGFEELDRLWRGEPEPSVLFGTVERAGRVFASFCDEVCTEAVRAA